MFMQKKIAPNLEHPLFLQVIAQALIDAKALGAEEIFK